MTSSDFTSDFAIVLGVAAVTSVVFRLLKQPSVLGYLGAGLIVGPYVPLPVFVDAHRVEALSEFGVVLVMFSVGLEFRLARLFRVVPTSGLVGLTQVGFLSWLGFALGRSMDFSPEASLFLGTSIAISSTMVVSKVYESVHVTADVREFVFGTLVVQDLLAIVIVAAMTAVAAGSGVTAEEVAGTVGRLGAVLVGLLAGGLLVVPMLVRLVRGMGDPATAVVVTVGLGFVMALVARELGYSVALGAFLAGTLVAESGEGHAIESELRPIKDIFAAVFFVSVGMTVDPRLVVANWKEALSIAAVVVGGQLVATTIAGLLSGNGLRRSVIAGASFGQVGEFAFIIAGIGRAAGVVPRSMQPILVTVAVLTAFTTPLAVRASGSLVSALERFLPTRFRTSLSLYEGWLEKVREEQSSPVEKSRFVRIVSALALDAALLIGISVATSVYESELCEIVGSVLRMRNPAERDLVVGIALLVSTPLFVGMFVSSRALGKLAAKRIFGQDSPPSSSTPGPSGAAAAFVRLGVQLMVLLAFGIPFSLVVAPVVGGTPLLGIVVVAAVVAVVLVYRAAGALDRDVRSGAATMLALLSQEAQQEEEAPPTPRESSMPGLADTPGVKLRDGAFAVGKTLATLDLRACTGATVVALRRADRNVVVPTGREALAAGDFLVVAGDDTARSAAERLLLHGPESV